jgi:hypothetical protein
MDAIFKAFDTHSIVLLGEVHWNLQQHRFIQRLLRDPRLPAKVNDIAVEFGNSLYQPLIDRYIGGEDVPLDSLRLVWRNNVVELAWDRTLYADFYATVRAVNLKLPTPRRIRVIALDPPIDWRTMTSAERFPRLWGYRDPVWIQILDRESLSKGRTVLVIAGGLHILRRDPPDFKPKPSDRFGLGDALAQRYPDRVYSIYPAVGRGSIATLTRRWPEGSLADVKGTTLGARSSSVLWPSSVTMFRTVNGKPEPYTLQARDYPPIESLVDAILYYGPDATLARLPSANYWDCEYLAELRRRNQLMLPVFGMDQRALIDSLASHVMRACPTASGGSRVPTMNPVVMAP